MQDNVTQSDREAAGRVFRAIGRDQSARLAELGRGGDGPVTLAIAAHRLASTAQPEVKALVEALQEATSALEGSVPDLDDAICCSGFHCGCRGASNRDLLVHKLNETLAAHRESQP